MGSKATKEIEQEIKKAIKEQKGGEGQGEEQKKE